MAEKGHDTPVDVLVFNIARRVARPVVPWILNELKTHDRNMWNQIAWVFLRADRAVREAWIGVILGGGIVLEQFVDFTHLPHFVKDVIERGLADISEDLDGYFKRPENLTAFEAVESTLKPLSVDDATSMATKFKDFMKTALRRFGEWLQGILQIPRALRMSHESRFVQALETLDFTQATRLKEFFERVGENGLFEFKRRLHHFDQPHELINFVSHDSVDQMVVMFELAKLIEDPLDWHKINRAARRSWVVAEEAMKEFSTTGQTTTGELAESMEAGNVVAKHRADRELQQAKDKRATAKEARAKQFSPLKLGMWLLVGLAAFFIGLTVVQRQFNEPPVITITSPKAGQALDQPVTAIAKVIDTNLIKSIQYQVDGGQPHSPPFFQANMLTISIPLGTLSPGPHTLRINARDDQGKVGSTEASFIVKYSSEEITPTDSAVAAPTGLAAALRGVL